MAPHERSRSRGSFSLFSFDTIRSLSRTGSRQAVRISSKDELQDRSESKLSYRCDPQDQPPASPGPDPTMDVISAAPRATTPEEEHSLGADHNAQDTSEILVHKRGDSRRRAQRTRRLSWLPFTRSSSISQHPRSHSVHLPKVTSASTVARSVISAPVLTSTTNAKVARIEGVYCRELAELEFSQSAGNSQADRHPHAQQSSGHALTSTSGGNNNVLPNTTVKRGRMLRLGDAVRSRFKDPLSRRQSGKSLRTEKVNGADERSDPTVENGIAHRGTEALNLYRGKIKGLTGNGHIRRKSVNNDKASCAQHDPPLLAELTDHLMSDEGVEQSDTDSAFGSLTRSFASAVDKLDFSPSLAHNVPFLRSRSSFFNLKKDKDGGKRSEARRQASGTSSSLLQSPSASVPSSSTPTTLRKTRPSPSPPHQSAQGNPTSQSTPSSSVVFEGKMNGLLQNKLTEEELRTRHPLRMNPPMVFASPPVQSLRANPPIKPQTSASPQLRTTSPSGHSEDEEDTLSLDDAPIYSPSLGDLSQYARDTPPQKTAYRSEPPGPKAYNSTPTPTPTREHPASGSQRGVLKKSKSGIGLFSRSKSVKISTSANSKAVASQSSSVITTPSNPSPLSQRHVTRSDSTGKNKSVKKSKSLHFGGLFKRPSETDLTAPIPRDLSVPFQPATPSPLRNVTRVRDNDARTQSHSHNRRSASGP